MAATAAGARTGGGGVRSMPSGPPPVDHAIAAGPGGGGRGPCTSSGRARLGRKSPTGLAVLDHQGRLVHASLARTDDQIADARPSHACDASVAVDAHSSHEPHRELAGPGRPQR